MSPPPLVPLRLRADNVTPPQRTPWGGRRIVERYKRHLRLPAGPIGEAWEISVEPSFPSRIESDGLSLAEIVAEAPEAWLGAALARRHGGQLPLLVKLLDAADNLSVQVHPDPDDPSLAEGESGKPEAWIILEADPGSVIYLGFREGVRREAVEAALDAGAAIESLLHRTPVAAGDVFVIEAGVVHAIGAGVTLVEPQHVLPGRRAVTYRLWDWDRRYDAAGRPDPSGSPRALHRQQALDVIRWREPQGAALEAAARRQPRVMEVARRQPRVTEAARLRRLALVETAWFAAERWQGTGRMRVQVETLLGLTCVGGTLRVAGPTGELTLLCGESAVLPAALGWIEVEALDADVIACRSVAPTEGPPWPPALRARSIG